MSNVFITGGTKVLSSLNLFFQKERNKKTVTFKKVVQ